MDCPVCLIESIGHGDWRKADIKQGSVDWQVALAALDLQVSSFVALVDSPVADLEIDSSSSADGGCKGTPKDTR